MRIVPNLTNLTECPNCGETFYLKEMKNEFGRPFVLCVRCHEEIYENETTCSEEQHAVYYMKKIADAKRRLAKPKAERKRKLYL